jgi:hypothetical protein
MPENMTVEEEVAFWESHNVTDYIDDTEAETGLYSTSIPFTSRKISCII